MPVPKKKPTTSAPDGSTPESWSNALPEQEEFRQHLRRVARSFVIQLPLLLEKDSPENRETGGIH